MAREEREVLRKRYTEKFPAGYQYSQARIDVIALLDAVEEAEDMLGSLEIAYNELKAENDSQKRIIRALESDLSHEKQNGEIMAKRAEALERAIRRHRNVTIIANKPFPCAICLNLNKDANVCFVCLDGCNTPFTLFKFAEDRFTKGEGTNG